MTHRSIRNDSVTAENVRSSSRCIIEQHLPSRQHFQHKFSQKQYDSALQCRYSKNFKAKSYSLRFIFAVTVAVVTTLSVPSFVQSKPPSDRATKNPSSFNRAPFKKGIPTTKSVVKPKSLHSHHHEEELMSGPTAIANVLADLCPHGMLPIGMCFCYCIRYWFVSFLEYLARSTCYFHELYYCSSSITTISVWDGGGGGYWSGIGHIDIGSVRYPQLVFPHFFCTCG